MILPDLVKAALYFSRHKLLQKKHALLASFKLTYRCNLRCKQCLFYDLNSPRPSYKQVCERLDMLYARGNRLLIFEGGEPFLWKDGRYSLQDVLAYARKKFFRVGITTNGTFPLEVNSDILWVSVDGLRDIHNDLRGRDIFDTVIANIKASSHPRIYAHITVNSVNAREIPQLIHFLDPLVRGITIQFYYPYNRQDQLFLNPDSRELLIEEIIRLKKKGLKVLNSEGSLRALQQNTWHCEDWLMDHMNPDGNYHQGCYLKGRTEIDCRKCGFSPHTEFSLAWQGRPASIWAGMQIFFPHR